MYQNKQHVVEFEAGTPPAERLDRLADALIEQGVPRGHKIALQAPGMPDYDVGRWDVLYCSNEDLTLATSALITW